MKQKGRGTLSYLDLEEGPGTEVLKSEFTNPQDFLPVLQLYCPPGFDMQGKHL